jgi:cell division protein FtsW
MARVAELAPARTGALPEAGLSRGWEPAAIVGLTLLLLSFGMVTLYSASSFIAQRAGQPDTYYVLRQAVGAGLGLVLMVICAILPYQVWKRFAWPLVGLTWVLLVVLVLPGTEAIAPEINGARRWLRLGGMTFQPSELAKLTIIVWSAALCVRKEEHFRSLSRGLLPFLTVWAALLSPILLEPDLSTTALVGLLGAMVVFAGGARIAHFVFLALLSWPVIQRELAVGFRADRLSAFGNLSAHAEGVGFQVRQSLIAIGSGGITGVGFGEGRQKFGFLPESHNDFIVAMIGEEWGLLGLTFTVALYLALVVVGFRVARRAPDLFGHLLAIGVSCFIGLHAMLHMAVGLGLVPATGLPLPLISYGRSNLMITLMALGILMSVARGAEALADRTDRARAEVDLARPLGDELTGGGVDGRKGRGPRGGLLGGLGSLLPVRGGGVAHG